MCIFVEKGPSQNVKPWFCACEATLDTLRLVHLSSHVMRPWICSCVIFIWCGLQYYHVFVHRPHNWCCGMLDAGVYNGWPLRECEPCRLWCCEEYSVCGWYVVRGMCLLLYAFSSWINSICGCPRICNACHELPQVGWRDQIWNWALKFLMCIHRYLGLGSPKLKD